MIHRMKHLPQIVKETAMDMVLDLHNSQWFIRNNISDPRYALEFLCDRIMMKYLDNCLELPSKQKIFTVDEFKGIQDRIIQNNLLLLLKQEGFIQPLEVGNEFKFLITPKGITNLPFILNQQMLWQEHQKQ